MYVYLLYRRRNAIDLLEGNYSFSEDCFSKNSIMIPTNVEPVIFRFSPENLVNLRFTKFPIITSIFKI